MMQQLLVVSRVSETNHKLLCTLVFIIPLASRTSSPQSCCNGRHPRSCCQRPVIVDCTIESRFCPVRRSRLEVSASLVALSRKELLDDSDAQDSRRSHHDSHDSDPRKLPAFDDRSFPAACASCLATSDESTDPAPIIFNSSTTATPVSTLLLSFPSFNPATQSKLKQCRPVISKLSENVSRQLDGEIARSGPANAAPAGNLDEDNHFGHNLLAIWQAGPSSNNRSHRVDIDRPYRT